ncbi:response regulator transcription factor [Candidatus Nitrosocosmicus hydrocola]|uniref:response regulator transcription factor n=1 Tax=Candidatus Nitrosocosmicus hydrocola TaxID=1826872 RepID=UPI0013734CD5|nr:response regulator [Candidatus Nitrosocosmicus hydrocola]
MGKYSNINELYNSISKDIKHSIILVDDDIDVSNLLAGYFTLAKFNVHKVISAEECLAKLKELESKVDVVLVNGNIAADRGPMLIVNIKKLNLKINVLALTDNETNKTRVLDYGADEFAIKPISPTTIVEKVSGLLMKKPAELQP